MEGKKKRKKEKPHYQDKPIVKQALSWDVTPRPWKGSVTHKLDPSPPTCLPPIQSKPWGIPNETKPCMLKTHRKEPVMYPGRTSTTDDREPRDQTKRASLPSDLSNKPTPKTIITTHQSSQRQAPSDGGDFISHLSPPLHLSSRIHLFIFMPSRNKKGQIIPSLCSHASHGKKKKKKKHDSVSSPPSSSRGTPPSCH